MALRMPRLRRRLGRFNDRSFLSESAGWVEPPCGCCCCWWWWR